MGRGRRWKLGHIPAGPAAQSDRIAWAGELEAIVLWSDTLDLATTRRLAELAAAIVGERAEEERP